MYPHSPAPREPRAMMGGSSTIASRSSVSTSAPSRIRSLVSAWISGLALYVWTEAKTLRQYAQTGQREAWYTYFWQFSGAAAKSGG